MILRPVTPQSAAGPPFTKLPLGFTVKRMSAIVPRAQRARRQRLRHVVADGLGRDVRRVLRRDQHVRDAARAGRPRRRPRPASCRRGAARGTAPARRSSARPARQAVGQQQRQRQPLRASRRWRSRTRCPGRPRPARRPVGRGIDAAADLPGLAGDVLQDLHAVRAEGASAGRRSRPRAPRSRTMRQVVERRDRADLAGQHHHAGLARAPRRPRGCGGRARGTRRGSSRR